jgi:hypothetical protein
MISTLTLDQFEKNFFKVECQEMRSDIYSHIFDSVDNMDENLQHFVSIFKKGDVIEGALHYSCSKTGVLLNHFHVCKNARENHVLYELLKETLVNIQLNDIVSITINTTYLIANKLLLEKVTQFITDYCNLKVTINVYEDFL